MTTNNIHFPVVACFTLSVLAIKVAIDTTLLVVKILVEIQVVSGTPRLASELCCFQPHEYIRNSSSRSPEFDFLAPAVAPILCSVSIPPSSTAALQCSSPNRNPSEFPLLFLAAMFTQNFHSKSLENRPLFVSLRLDFTVKSVEGERGINLAQMLSCLFDV